MPSPHETRLQHQNSLYNGRPGSGLSLSVLGKCISLLNFNTLIFGFWLIPKKSDSTTKSTF